MNFCLDTYFPCERNVKLCNYFLCEQISLMLHMVCGDFFNLKLNLASTKCQSNNTFPSNKTFPSNNPYKKMKQFTKLTVVHTNQEEIKAQKISAILQ